MCRTFPNTDPDTARALPRLTVPLTDHGRVFQDLKRRVGTADLPDPLFAVLGAVDLAVRAPAAAGKYYGQLVEHGHARLVEVGTQRAVHKRVSRIEQTVTPRARRWAVKRSQRQRRLRRDRSA